MAAQRSSETQRSQVESFLFREASLLDQHDYEEWLGLWADEARYWVPGPGADGTSNHQVAIIDDDRQDLADRVFRLNHPGSHAHRMRPRVARTVSNIEIESGSAEAFVVHSVVVIVVNRRGEQAVYAGRVRHELLRAGVELEMRSKKVVLTASDDPLRNLTFLP